MINSSIQLPFQEVDTVVEANGSYFHLLPMGHRPTEIKCNQVIVKNEIRGDEGSKTYTSNYTDTAATKVLNPRSGEIMHLIQ